MLPSVRGIERQIDTNTTLDFILVRIRGTFPRPMGFQRNEQTRALPRRRRRSPRPRWCTTSTNQQHNKRSRHPISSPSGHPTIFFFLHSDSDGRRDGSFHDRPISFLEDPSVLRSSHMVHFIIGASLWAWGRGFMPRSWSHSLKLYLIALYFCILPFIGDLLVLLHCIDIIVLNNPFDLLLWSLVG